MVEAGGGLPVPPVATQPGLPGQPVLRWSSRANTLDGVQRELARIWARRPEAGPDGGDPELHVAARTSVLNLVVAVRRPEVGQRVAATIAQLTGRHPSRTLVISAADPDGPSWLDGQIQVFCVVPRIGAAETCAEMIYLTAGGDAGRHLHALTAPLLIHDLPVTLWVPGEPSFGSAWAKALTDAADQLIVDGSRWSGNGLARLGQLAELTHGRLAISDFALMRQSRWQEAIAATFDMPDFTPFLRSIHRIDVTYATHDTAGHPALTNIVKPLYHVAWVAGRLTMRVTAPLAAIAASAAGTGRAGGSDTGPADDQRGDSNDQSESAAGPGGFDATLRHGTGLVHATLRPRISAMPEGTTLRVCLLATRRGSELRTEVTAEAETVACRVWRDGVAVLERRFMSQRRLDVDLLAEAIESTGHDRIERETIRMAGALATADPRGEG